MESSYENEFSEGYDLAESEWKIWYDCSFCGKSIALKAESESRNAIIRFMKGHRLGHAKSLLLN